MGGGRSRSAWAGADAESSLEPLVRAAVEAVRAGRTATEAACERLAREGRPAVAVAAHLVRRAGDELANRGWSPEDVDHVVTRRLSPAHGRVAAGESSPGATVRDAVQLLVEALALMVTLPQLPSAGRAGGAGRDLQTDGLDARIVKRVRALLTKAESTDFPEEAEALTAKAQELISRHAIDAVRVRLGTDLGSPSSRRVYLDEPYVDPKALLLERVAAANRCTTVYASAFSWSTVFGYDADLDAVELLTASLLAQATRGLVRHGSRTDAAGRSRTRSFRRAFLVGFAHRIGERLRDATDAQVAEADATDGRLLPVLAARDDRVEAAQAAAYPHVVSHSTGVSNGAGWVAGRAAADLADLSTGAGMLDSQVR